MTDNDKKPSYRILSIDDNQAIHQDFAKILLKTSNDDENLDDLEAALFGASGSKTDYLDFTLDFATHLPWWNRPWRKISHMPWLL